MATIYAEKVKELENKINAYKEMDSQCEDIRESLTIGTVLKNKETGETLSVLSKPENEVFFFAGNLNTGEQETYYYLSKTWEVVSQDV